MHTTFKTNFKHMKSFLTITALLEGVTGLVLAIIPSSVVSILLGIPLTEPGAILIGRLAGGALLTIAFACWLSRNDSKSSVMGKVMAGYNIFTATLLLYAALGERIKGPGLWPVVLIHLVLLVWCLWSLRKRV